MSDESWKFLVYTGTFHENVCFVQRVLENTDIWVD